MNPAAEWGAHHPVRMVIITLMMSIIIISNLWLLVWHCLILFVHGDAMVLNQPRVRTSLYGNEVD